MVEQASLVVASQPRWDTCHFQAADSVLTGHREFRVTDQAFASNENKRRPFPTAGNRVEASARNIRLTILVICCF